MDYNICTCFFVLYVYIYKHHHILYNRFFFFCVYNEPVDNIRCSGILFSCAYMLQTLHSLHKTEHLYHEYTFFQEFSLFLFISFLFLIILNVCLEFFSHKKDIFFLFSLKIFLFHPLVQQSYSSFV